MTAIRYLEPPLIRAEESVWDYPKTPQVEAVHAIVCVVFNATIIAESQRAKRVLQQGIAPTYYLPADDIEWAYLFKTGHRSYCEGKGFAEYWTLKVKERRAKNAAWGYPASPDQITPKGHIAFYAHLVDACYLGGEQVSSPPWAWIGGWATSNVKGPFLTKEQCKTYFTKQSQTEERKLL